MAVRISIWIHSLGISIFFFLIFTSNSTYSAQNEKRPSYTRLEYANYAASPAGSGWGTGIEQFIGLSESISITGSHTFLRKFGISEQVIGVGFSYLPVNKAVGIAADLGLGSGGDLAPKFQFGTEVSLIESKLQPVFGYRGRYYSNANVNTFTLGADFYPQEIPIYWILRSQSSVVSNRSENSSNSKGAFAGSLKTGFELPKGIQPTLSIGGGQEGAVVDSAYLGQSIRIYDFYSMGAGVRSPYFLDSKLQLEVSLDWQRYPTIDLQIFRSTLGVRFLW